MFLTTMAFRALSIASRRPSLRSASLACTALASLGLFTEAGAQPAPATPQTLAARMASAKSGETILLASGAYGHLNIYARKFPGAGLVIQAQPGATPVFTGIDIGASEGITVKNVEIGLEPPAPNGGTVFGVAISNSNHVNVAGLKIHGASDKQLSGNAVMLRNDTEVSVADSEVRDLGTGINFLDSDHIQVLRNTFSDIQSDSIRGASSHVEVTGNRASNFHPQPGDHPDFIQFWSTREATSTGNRITGNVYERGQGEGVQGVFIEDNKDLVISGNALLGPAYNAIGLSRTRGAVIEDNFIQSYPDMGARIITRGTSDNVTVRNNVSPLVVSYADDGKPNTAYKEQGNKPIKTAKPGDNSAMQAWLAAKREQH